MGMVVQSSLNDLLPAQRFFAYADGYLDAATTLNERILKDMENLAWPSASVVLMLGAHAVELFYKAAVLSRQPGEYLEGHNIDDLREKYEKACPEEKFRFDAPFSADASGLLEEYPEIPRPRISTPSVLYRYPLDRGGRRFEGAYAFEPIGYSVILAELRTNFLRVKLLLNS